MAPGTAPADCAAEFRNHHLQLIIHRCRPPSLTSSTAASGLVGERLEIHGRNPEKDRDEVLRAILLRGLDHGLSHRRSKLTPNVRRRQNNGHLANCGDTLRMELKVQFIHSKSWPMAIRSCAARSAGSKSGCLSERPAPCNGSLCCLPRRPNPEAAPVVSGRRKASALRKFALLSHHERHTTH